MKTRRLLVYPIEIVYRATRAKKISQTEKKLYKHHTKAILHKEPNTTYVLLNLILF